MSGDERRVLWRGWLCGVAIVAGVSVLNIQTIHHDAPELGLLPPVIWEVSSALVTVVILLLPALMAIWTGRRRPPWQLALLAHAGAALTYSILHVAGFLALRQIAYRVLIGEPYDFGPLTHEFPYELRKDIVAYGFAFAVFWLLMRLRGPAEAPPPGSALPAMFDIRDGARLVRAPIGEILAVRAVGNYAEFLLADGRRPLTRSSLSALEARLAEHGFLRTHRSWLINSARVTGLRPEGSGDYAVELGAQQAPLSRRFPAALAALRG